MRSSKRKRCTTNEYQETGYAATDAALAESGATGGPSMMPPPPIPPLLHYHHHHLGVPLSDFAYQGYPYAYYNYGDESGVTVVLFF